MKTPHLNPRERKLLIVALCVMLLGGVAIAVVVRPAED